jgi:hypothetical protein
LFCSLIDRRGFEPSDNSSDCQLLSSGKFSNVTEPDMMMSEVDAVNVRHEYYGTTSSTVPSSTVQVSQLAYDQVENIKVYMICKISHATLCDGK